MWWFGRFDIVIQFNLFISNRVNNNKRIANRCMKMEPNSLIKITDMGPTTRCKCLLLVLDTIVNDLVNDSIIIKYNY